MPRVAAAIRGLLPLTLIVPRDPLKIVKHAPNSRRNKHANDGSQSNAPPMSQPSKPNCKIAKHDDHDGRYHGPQDISSRLRVKEIDSVQLSLDCGQQDSVSRTVGR